MSAAPLEKAVERFNAIAKLPSANGCLLWMGAMNETGYGRFRLNGRQTGAHRAAWTLANGPIPAGLCVMHECDTPSCVNVSHLRLGTYSENEFDKVAKGRHPCQRRTLCPHGHPLDSMRTNGERRNRRCRTCHAEGCRAWRQKRKA